MYFHLQQSFLYHISLLIIRCFKKVIDTARKEIGKCGQKRDVGITFHTLPFGNRLWGHAEQPSEFFLCQAVFPSVCLNLLRNKNSFHDFQYVSRSRAMMPNAIISRRMVQ